MVEKPMIYGERLKSSFAHLKRSPSLLSVMLLEFILGVLLGALFFIGDLAIIVYLNKVGLAAFNTDALDIAAFLSVVFNTKTLVVMSFVLLLQGFIFVYLDSFFKAGFYGMLKNAIHDGSTTFNEFIPEAKHYWYAMFRFLLLRYSLMLVFAIPFLLALLSYAGTSTLFVTAAQSAWLLGTFLFFLLATIIIFFWLFYGEAIIVFEDAGAKEAIADSARMTRRHLGTTIVSLLIVGAIVIIATLLESLLSTPFDLLAMNYAGAELVSQLVKFLLNIITICAGIVASVFIFLTYDNLTTTRAVRKPAEKLRAKKPIKRKA